MNTILIIAAFQSFLLALLLLGKRGKRIPDYILSGYFTVSALTILLAYLEIVNRNLGYAYPWLIQSSIPTIFLLGPLIWLYVKSLTTQHFKFKRIYLLLIVPFVFIASMLAARIFFSPESVKISMEKTESFRNDFMFPLVLSLIALSNIGYTLWGIILIGRYRKGLKAYFSRTDKIDLAWLKFFLVSMLLGYISISSLYIIDAIFGLMDYNTLQVVGYGIVSIFVLILGFYGLKQGSVFVTSEIKIDFDKNLDLKSSSNPLTDREEQLVAKLLSMMKVEKLHQNPDITLSALSDSLGVTPEILSGILNGRLNMNFFDFINHYRIEEFKQKCKDPNNKNITLIALAFDCGFNSKATFNRVFKKNVGCTPSEYYARVSVS